MVDIQSAAKARRLTAPLAAVDLQGDLVRLLKELLCDAEHRELVVRRLSLGKAGLHDVDANRDSTGSAEVPDLNKALPSTDFEASGSAAFGPPTVFTSASLAPRLTINWKRIGLNRSPMIFRPELGNKWCTSATRPAMEFSTGIMPSVQAPDFTASKASSNVG